MIYRCNLSVIDVQSGSMSKPRSSYAMAKENEGAGMLAVLHLCTRRTAQECPFVSVVIRLATEFCDPTDSLPGRLFHELHLQLVCCLPTLSHASGHPV